MVFKLAAFQITMKSNNGHNGCAIELHLLAYFVMRRCGCARCCLDESFRKGLLILMKKAVEIKLNWFVLFGLAMVVFSGGCGNAPVAVPQEVSFPAELTIDGSQWKKKEWTDAETKRVDAYFKKSPYLADNPGFSGKEVCYTNDAGKERCYWVLATDGSTQWIMIEFDGAKGSPPTEGTGAPFTETGQG